MLSLSIYCVLHQRDFINMLKPTNIIVKSFKIYSANIESTSRLKNGVKVFRFQFSIQVIVTLFLE